MVRALLPSLLASALAVLLGCDRGLDEADEPGPSTQIAPTAAAEEEEPPAPVSDERARLEDACAESDAQACFALAEMLERGEGGPAEPTRARALYEQACAEGSYEACDALGH